jgi:hypothetical protein
MQGGVYGIKSNALFMASQSFCIALEVIKHKAFDVVSTHEVGVKAKSMVTDRKGLLVTIHHPECSSLVVPGQSIVGIKLKSPFIDCKGFLVAFESMESIGFSVVVMCVIRVEEYALIICSNGQRISSKCFRLAV